ncbi:MAG: hypothetical protein ABFR89_07015 [Actinomycetota bacterium]
MTLSPETGWVGPPELDGRAQNDAFLRLPVPSPLACRTRTGADND